MATKNLDPDKRYAILVLQHGTTSKTLKNATVRSFEQTERVYDEEGIAVGKTTETRWEAHGMHQNRSPDPSLPPDKWPEYEEEMTVGFDPKSVVKAEEVK